MPPKKSQKASDDGLDQYLEKIQPQQTLNEKQIIVAVLLSLVPAYLYSSVYDLSISEYVLVYLAVSAAVAAMLALAYRNVQQGQHAFLSSSRKSGSYPSAKSAAETEALFIQESHAWSFFLNNAIFIGLFLFLAFYALRSVETLYNYVLSMLVSAVVTWQLSSSR